MEHKFDEVISSYDLVKNEEEPCVYMKVSGSAITFLVLYVDDILIIGNDVGMLSTIKTWLSRQFSMRTWGKHPISWGLESIEMDPRGCLACPSPGT